MVGGSAALRWLSSGTVWQSGSHFSGLRHALQIPLGVCTPGVVVTLTYLLRQGPLAPDDVVEALEAHHCRCTGYYAFLRAAALLI